MTSSSASPIQFALNGVTTNVSCRPDTTVLEWLREDAVLRGTKEGCAEGDCGACTVLVRNAKTQSAKGTQYRPVNSCILLMGQLEGASLITVEGLSDGENDLHPIQKHMAENGSSQCGYCTPGIVASLAGLLQYNTDPTDDQIHDALAGNLCRCTGYKPIVEAALKAAREGVIPLSKIRMSRAKPVVEGDNSIFHLPASLSELLALKSKRKKAILLAGGTDLSLDVAHAKARWDEVILTQHVVELRNIEKSKTHLILGSAVTWDEALPHLEKYWPQFAQLVRRFGSVQIRSKGTIGGNIGNASPIGDGPPALIALGATLHLANQKGARELPMDSFFIDYRKTALKPGEVIVSIQIPLPKVSDEFYVYKISKRFDQDISTVCGAFFVSEQKGIIEECRLAFGGMAAVPKRCKGAEKALIGKPLTSEVLKIAKREIAKEFNALSDMRGSAKYRMTVASNLLDRMLADRAGEIVQVMDL